VSFDPHALKLFVDGSCLKNPGGNSGFAVWVEYPSDWDRADELLQTVGFHESTNNRMELKACIWAHRWVQEQGAAIGVQRVQVITDSKHVHDCWQQSPRWRSNGWRNADGKQVENKDLWKELLSIRTKLRIRVDIEWTPGKKTPITKAVDKSAKSGAKQPTRTDWGHRSGKIGRSKNSVGGSAALFPAAGQEARIRVYHAVAFGDGENKIKFQLFSEARGEFLDKFVAYATPEIGGALHRHHAYCVRFNSNPRYPIIEVVLHEIQMV
jgi:ribonuclease HI